MWTRIFQILKSACLQAAKKGSNAKKIRAVKLQLETLEERFLPSVTWVGENSSDWNTDSNWKGGNKPKVTDDVIIPVVSESKHAPVSNGRDEARSIKIESGGTLEV